MTRFYDIDEANEALREVEPLLLGLRDQRAELIRVRDVILERSASPEGQARGEGAGDAPAGTTTADTRTLRLRMQGLIDQMQAAVTGLVERDVTLREIESGLIDFPALVNGRQVWLCWRLGEDRIGWWHELGDGFGGRRSLDELT